MLFSLLVDTWCKAIDSIFFQSWMHITSVLVCKHMPLLPNTVLEHQHQARQNVRLTKTPIQASKNIALIFQPEEFTNKLFTDQTGQSPHPWSKCNQYVMVAYTYKPNTIFADPLKNRTSASLLNAYERVYNNLDLVGFKPSLHILDNKASAEFKLFLHTQDLTFQLVPPVVWGRY